MAVVKRSMARKRKSSTGVATATLKGPRLYILLDPNNNPEGGIHTKEREAYDEKKAFESAGFNVKVQPYEPSK